MVKIHSSTSPFLSVASRCYALLFEQDCVYGEFVESLESHKLPGLRRLLADQNFFGRAGQIALVPHVTDEGVSYFIMAGLGARKTSFLDIEQYRRAIGACMHEVARLKAVELVMLVPHGDMFGVSDYYLASQTAIIADMAHYHFDEFITDEQRKYPDELLMTVVLDGHNEKEIERGLTYGTVCARGVTFARHWVDMPPDHSTPIQLAEKAREVALRNGFAITVFNESEINQMGMGGLAAVARGSERDCQLVIMQYRCGKPDTQTIGIVGKGITFDSGGLSIKPADYMETMKDDMAGAAAVLGTMEVIGEVKPAVNVIAIMPLAENLPSGKAIKPGDIVTFYNGKTGEILNTDAEGRLVLADALAYAVKHYKLDALIDLATLTGACTIALGHFFSALLTADDELANRLAKASESSGERIWRLPLADDFKNAIKSEFADVQNIGNKRYGAGTITAACFLQHFVGSVPWAHLDIAGTSFGVPDISYYKHGSTGWGVRLLSDLLISWDKGALPDK